MERLIEECKQAIEGIHEISSKGTHIAFIADSSDKTPWHKKGGQRDK